MVEIKTTKEQKESHCYKCGKVLTKKPIRLCVQEYGVGKYKQYCPIGLNIDLCGECFKIFVEWVNNNVKKKI